MGVFIRSNIKIAIKSFLLFIVLLFSCGFSVFNRSVNVKLDPKNNGWYFIKLIKDTALRDSGTVNIEFKDTARCVTIRIKDIDKLVVNPFDYKGNSLSLRLQYFGVKNPDSNHPVLEFYNPTDEELKDIDNWNPTNKRAREIFNEGEQAFKKYSKDTVGK